MRPFSRRCLEFSLPSRCPLCEGWLERDSLVHRGCLRARRTARWVAPPAGRGTLGIAWLWEDDPSWFRLLHRAKYGAEPDLLLPLARPLARAALEHRWLHPGCLLLPLPEDPQRARSRGGSPLGAFAARLARATGLPLAPPALRRRPGRPAQAKLEGAGARRANAASCWATGRLDELPPGQVVVLVDDQVTSGATLGAAARLVAARGHAVRALALAGAASAPRSARLTPPPGAA